MAPKDDVAVSHFVLTRFNIASEGREVAIRNSPGWLERRFDLFKTYCLPSMAAQTCQNFRWLIYFDHGTPRGIRERIAQAQKIFPFEAVFVGPFDMKMTAHDVASRLSPEAARIITTRLDNDDAVSIDFIEKIQTYGMSCASGTVLNFTHGIALRNRLAYSACDASNPFTSLVSCAADVRVIWEATHRSLAETFDLQQVSDGPVWLQVVHGENVANRIKGRLLPISTIAESFVIDKGTFVEPSRGQILLDRTVFWPIRYTREMLIGLIKAVAVRK